MKYSLSILDLDSAKNRKTSLFQAILKEDVNPVRLRKAVKNAALYHPSLTFCFSRDLKADAKLAKGQLSPADEKAHLEVNPQHEPSIWHASLYNRPVLGTFYPERDTLEFNSETLYQICWYENYIIFEWLPLLTDTTGALRFFNTILENYYLDENLYEGVEPSDQFEKSFECSFNSSVKSVGQIPQPSGYVREAVPVNDFYITHVLHLYKSDIANISKKDNDTSLVVLIPLWIRALQKTLQQPELNVSTKFTLDERDSLNTQTVRVSSYNKIITYDAHLNRYGLEQVSTIYRHSLDVFSERENLYSYQPTLVGEANLCAEEANASQLDTEIKNLLLDFRIIEMPLCCDAMFRTLQMDDKITLVISERYQAPVFEAFLEMCKQNGIAIQNDEKIIL